MRHSLAPKTRRLQTALIAFPLALASGLIVWNRGREFEAKRHVSTSTALATEPGELIADNAFTAPAALLMKEGDYQRALGYYLARLADARGDAQHLAIAEGLRKLGQSAHARDKGKGSITITAFREAIALYKALGLPDLAAQTLLELKDPHKLRGENREAFQVVMEAEVLAAPSKDRGLHSNVLYTLAELEREQGEYAKATELYQKALTIREAIQNPEAVANCITGLGRIDSERGHFDQAIARFEDSEKRLAAIGKLQTRAAVLGSHGDALVKLGRLSKAEALYREGLTVWEECHHPFFTSAFLARLARLAYLRGELIAARKLAQKSLPLLDDSNGPLGKTLPLHVLGLVAQQSGNRTEAVRLHREALALRRLNGSPRSIAEGLHALASDLDRSSSEASALLTEAEALQAKYDFAI